MTKLKKYQPDNEGKMLPYWEADYALYSDAINHGNEQYALGLSDYKEYGQNPIMPDVGKKVVKLPERNVLKAPSMSALEFKDYEIIEYLEYLTSRVEVLENQDYKALLDQVEGLEKQLDALLVTPFDEPEEELFSKETLTKVAERANEDQREVSRKAKEIRETKEHQGEIEELDVLDPKKIIIAGGTRSGKNYNIHKIYCDKINELVRAYNYLLKNKKGEE